MRSPFAAFVQVSVAHLFLIASADAQPQTPDQQSCLNAVNKAGARVAKVQGKNDVACVKNAGKGKEPDAQGCLTADSKGKVAGAQSKTAAAVTKKCGAAPDFGFAGAGTVNLAAAAEEVALTADVFGADLTAVIIDASTDPAGAKCQVAVAKAYEKLAVVKMKTFLRCKKDGLKAGTIDSSATLEACFDAITADAKGKIAKAKAKITAAVDKKCTGTTLDVAFPGACIGASSFTDCVDEQVECRICRTLDAMDVLARDCETFDDGLANASCIAPPTTTTTTTTSTTTTTTMGPDWGLDCFDTASCAGFCAGAGCVCGGFLGSVGVPGGMAMCFFDCMDASGTVTSCRPACGGPAGAPACETGVAGSGGYTGAVTGAGKCEPTGFSAGVTLGGTASELKRLVLTFSAPIDETTLFDGAPPACAVGCPPTCPPTAVAPLTDRFRLQFGVASPPAEMCDRLGVAVTACKASATSYILALTSSVCTPVPVDVSAFVSCHVGDGLGGFLHLSTGDFFASTTWPP